MEFFLVPTQSFAELEDLLLLLPLLLLLLSGGAIVVIACCFLSPHRVLRRLRRNGLRGPPPTFPLGNLMEMFRKNERAYSSSSFFGLSSITHDIHSLVFPYFARWRKTYGNVFVYWLGTEPFLYVTDPEFLKKATSGAMGKKWGKPEVFKRDRRPMFGNGLVMTEADDWVLHRNIIAPAFSMTNLNAMIIQMEESTHQMLENWSRHVDLGQSEIDLEEYLMDNAAEIIAKTSFGISDEAGKKAYEMFRTMQTMLFKTNRLVGVPFSKFLNPISSYRAWKLGKDIDRLLLQIIVSRRNAGGGASRQDLLSLLLAGNQENARLERKLTTRELIDECKTFFFGGHETTALALTWTLFLLASYPEWQTALRDEVMEVSDGGPLDATVLSKLTKMGWVLNEVLRLYSPAPNAQRQAREDIRVGDTVVPRGTNLWVDVVGMHHDPELWGEDVFEFKPERFKDDARGGCRHRMGFLPFGFGGRTCVGRNLTLLEYKIVLCLVLRRFSLSVPPSYSHAPRIMLTLRPSHGMHLVIRRLEES